MPAEAQHLRNICARPAGVSTRTTSGFLPQKRQIAWAALASWRAVTFVLDVFESFFAILHLVLCFTRHDPPDGTQNQLCVLYYTIRNHGAILHPQFRFAACSNRVR